jgi:Coenzyme PQQ synthesis protein D (PqqD)
MTVLRLKADGVEWQEVEGEILALVGETSTYVAANATGTVLWRRLANGATQDELVAALVDEYDLIATDASADVASFLDSLRAQGLLAE